MGLFSGDAATRHYGRNAVEGGSRSELVLKKAPQYSLAYGGYQGGESTYDVDHLRYQLEFNSRQRSDRMPSTLRYHYPPGN